MRVYIYISTKLEHSQSLSYIKLSFHPTKHNKPVSICYGQYLYLTVTLVYKLYRNIILHQMYSIFNLMMITISTKDTFCLHKLT